MLPVAVASLLLLVSGVWWSASILSSLYWERRFETLGRRSERLQERKEGRGRVSSVVGPIMFSVPSVVTLGLALDGFAGSRVIFYAPGWSWFLPGAETFQLFGAIFVFVALPLFTWTVYLIERYVYSRVPSERVLIERGPYARTRHPMHLAAFLLGIGWVLLAENFAALILLFLLQGVIVARKEEAELIETYGDAYRAYQRRTGFFLPRWRKSARNEPRSFAPRS
jgi:protein-S-isoprenylcysteine O-methyltransferase Ste14